MSVTEANSKNSFRVLIADDDGNAARRLLDFLKEKGFSAEQVTSGRAAKDKIREWNPHFVIVDLMLPEVNAPALLTWLKNENLAQKPKVFVTSAHSIVQNIKECISLGASDYIVKPYKYDDIVTRLVFHIQNKREVTTNKAGSVQLEGADIYLHLLDIVLREATSGRHQDEILYNLSKMVAITLKAVRCSIVMIAEDLQTGRVMASSDKRDIKGFQLDMNKYPEMLHVMTTQKAVVVEDLAYDPVLAQIKDLVKGISFNSMIVSPIMRNGDTFGVISARMDTKHSKFNERDIRFVQLVSQIISLYLSSNIALPHELIRDIKSA